MKLIKNCSCYPVNYKQQPFIQRVFIVIIIYYASPHNKLQSRIYLFNHSFQYITLQSLLKKRSQVQMFFITDNVTQYQYDVKQRP